MALSDMLNYACTSHIMFLKYISNSKWIFDLSLNSL